MNIIILSSREVKAVNILSLFDGMSCGYLAMLKAEVSIDRYVAYEIDKYAVKTSKYNFPDIEHRGDVFDADFTEFEGFDFLVGGSPCTYWSIAQSPDKRETTASGMGWELFSQYVRALNEAKPKYFIYENNKSMSKAIRASIDETFGFEAVCINSALVSAQSRKRLYWVGKRTTDGTYRKVNVEQPEDRGILLKDILDGAVAMNTKSNGKSQTLKAQYSHTNVTNICCYNSTFGATGAAVSVAQRGRYKDNSNETEQQFEIRGQKTNALTTVQKDNLIAEPLRVGTMPMSDGSIKQNRQWRIYSDKAKTITLMSNGGGGGAKTGLYAMPVDETSKTVLKEIDKVADKVGYVPEMFNAYNGTEITNKSPTLTTGSMETSSCAVNKFEPIDKDKYEFQDLKIRENAHVAINNNVTKINRIGGLYNQATRWGIYDQKGNAPTLTASMGMGGGHIPMIPEKVNTKSVKAVSVTDSKEYTVYEVKNKKITIKGKKYDIKLEDGYYIIRKLTVTECMRLQTVPEWYQFPVSDTQAYKMLGNGWTVDVIVHLIKSALNGNVEPEQMKLF